MSLDIEGSSQDVECDAPINVSNSVRISSGLADLVWKVTSESLNTRSISDSEKHNEQNDDLASSQRVTSDSIDCDKFVDVESGPDPPLSEQINIDPNLVELSMDEGVRVADNVP